MCMWQTDGPQASREHVGSSRVGGECPGEGHGHSEPHLPSWVAPCAKKGRFKTFAFAARCLGDLEVLSPSHTCIPVHTDEVGGLPLQTAGTVQCVNFIKCFI